MKTREEIEKDVMRRAEELEEDAKIFEFEAEELNNRAKRLYDAMEERRVPQRYKDRLEEYDRLVDNNHRLGIDLFSINSCIENGSLNDFYSRRISDSFSENGIPLARVLSRWFREDYSSAWKYSIENSVVEKMIRRDLTEEEYNRHFEHVQGKVGELVRVE